MSRSTPPATSASIATAATAATTASRSWRRCRPLWFRISSAGRILWIGASLLLAPLRPRFRFDPARLRVFILVRDLHSPLAPLVAAFRQQGIAAANITLVDTGSSAPACLAELQRLQALGCRLHTLPAGEQRFGPYCPWLSPSLRAALLAESYPFVVTDADLELPAGLPPHWLQDLLGALNAHRFALKASLPLRISDLTVAHRCEIIAHERGLIAHPGYRLLTALLLRHHQGRAVCTTDTTLSLYRPARHFSTLSVRLPTSYGLRHLPWYREFVSSDEFRHYTRHKLPLFGEWSSLAERS